jgi:hypothetical protein
MHIKNMSYHHTALKIAKRKSSDNSKYEQRFGETGCSGNVDWHCHIGK